MNAFRDHYAPDVDADDVARFWPRSWPRIWPLGGLLLAVGVGLTLGALLAHLRHGALATARHLDANAAIGARVAVPDRLDGARVADGALPARGRAPAPAPASVPAPGSAPAYREPIDCATPALSERELDDALQQAGVSAEPGQQPERPPWLVNAVEIADPGSAPMIAVVIDDLGLNRPNTRRAIGLPAPLTLAFLSYARDLQPMTATARRAGHELLLHLPMEPRGREDPGDNALLTGLPPSILAQRLAWSLGRFEGYVGINNHMGSRFTASVADMAPVLREVHGRGLLFLDSRTSSASVAAGLAKRLGLPFAQRDVFLDNDYENPAAIRRQLVRLEAVARSRGYAIGIGHPHDATLDELARWLPRAAARGLTLVPVSAIVRRTQTVGLGGAHSG